MKKIIPLLLLALMLIGCTQPAVPEDTLPTETQEVTPVQTNEGCYVPESQLEEATQGAVKLYQPDIADIQYILPMGENLLVVSGLDATILTKLTGDTLWISAQVKLTRQLNPELTHASASGISYWDAATQEVVFLDSELREHQRLKLSEQLVGNPVVSDNHDVIYYFTPTALRARDLQLGIDRTVKEIAYPHQTVCGLVMDGALIHCAISEDGETYKQLFIDSQTGQTKTQTNLDLNLTTEGSAFYVSAPEGAFISHFYSLDGTAVTELSPADLGSACVFLGNTLVAQNHDNQLEVYDLESGKRTARLTLPEDWMPLGDPVSHHGQIFFLATMGSTTGIAGWNTSASPVEEETVYTQPRSNPPLTQAKAKAKALSQTYGLTILVGQDAAVENRDYILEAETRDAVLLEELGRLEQLLARYPEGFFTTTASGTVRGQFTLCLTRSITGSPMSGRQEIFYGAQFWENEDAYMAIACGTDMETVFHEQLFHIMDNFILSRSKAYYEWEKLNPKGFAYDYDYTLNALRDPEQYLQENDRAFIDTYSMSFPQEDRARVFTYAMMAGNEGYFVSETMQEKLTAICKGIREAYGWKQSGEVFPWEQYLEKPLAKTK